ncbi:MAG: TonB-dependent receptor [Woeseia sp.]|nr:TonB-dependent receptor [Woeseia sp.]MBT8095927.1 TonB-dependent receptor [Woeseia sp.]NNE61073.1 TonB-dependent receptor [Woeseia sp.]NNL53753.1 TonB-dependent receptor [Woeseia sp.]
MKNSGAYARLWSWRRFSSILLFAVPFMISGPAVAQQSGDDENAEDEVIEEIITTGSRIPRAGIDTFYPAISVNTEELEDGAFTNVADALNELPSFGTPDATPFGAQNSFSVGQNFVDFLGLGAQRTLTLVDGRRFVSSNTPSIFGESGGLQVDFNVIPLALVDRIETIGVGGAPIYGSDAIAGTINVILKDRYEGIEFSGRVGDSFDGGSESTQFSLVAGANFDNGRGNVTMSAETFSQEGMLRTQRPRYTANDPYFASEEADGFRRIYYNQRVQLFSSGGAISPTGLFIPARGTGSIWGDLPDGNFYQFDSNSNLVPFIPGQTCPGSAFFACAGQDPNAPSFDGPDFFDNVAQIQSPLDREVFTARTTYDLMDDVMFSADVLFANSAAVELVNQGGFQTFAFGGTSGDLTFPADHPLLSQQARDLLAANGQTDFTLHRFNNDIIDSSDKREQFLWRASAGLEGNFDAIGRNFFWEVAAVHGQSDGETKGGGIIDGRFLNALEVRTLTQADIDAIPGGEASILAVSGTPTARAGDVICESVYQAAAGNVTGASGAGVTDADLPFIAGCVPLNLFGENARSLEARDWVTGDQLTQTDITQTIYNLNFGGDLFELPADWMSFNIGYEFRREEAAFVPGLGSKVPLTRSSPFDPTGGEYRTDEFYGELLVPVFTPDMNIPFFEFVELNTAVRDIRNSLAGDATVWTAGGRWAPVRDITFRGNYTESVRAPSLVELFAPRAQIFDFADDPCDNRFVDDGPNRRANCQAELGASYDPDTFVSNIVNATAIGSGGGNPGLKNEQAEAYALGMTIEPRWIENLTVTLDYIDIELTDAIQALSVEQLMVSCYDAAAFPNPSCATFERDAGGQVIDFSSGQENAALFKFSQFSLDVLYDFELASLVGLASDSWGSRDLGDLTLRARVSNPRKRSQSVIGEDPAKTIGGYTDPEYSGTFDVTWENDDMRLFWRTLWQDDALLDPDGDDKFEVNGQEVTKSDARFITNVSFAYSMDGLLGGSDNRTTLQLSINNLFDREPDLIQEAAGHFSTTELLGRQYYLTLRSRY